MTVENNYAQKKYKKVVPDGGYGYVIWVAVIIVFVTTMAFASVFGMLFNDAMIEMGMGSTSLTIMNGISGISFSVSGYAVGPLLKMISLQNLAYLGAAFISLGYVIVYFSYRQAIFFMSQATFSIGAGILYNISCTMLNDYFETKRLLSISITQSLTAIVSMVMPLVIKFTLEEFGYRGTIMLLIGIMMQNFVAASLMQPVSRHMKKVPIDTLPEEESFIETKGQLFDEDSEKEVVVKLSINESRKIRNIAHDSFEDSYNVNQEVGNPEIEIKKGILQRISDFMDLSLLKDFSVISACFGVSMSLFADITFIIMLPQALYALEFDEQTVAWALTLCGFGDLVARIAQTTFSKYLSKIKYKVIYMCGLSIACSTRMAMLLTSNEILIFILITLTGVSRCTIITLMPLVISDSVEPARFPGAMGIFMIVFGGLNLTVGPLVGSIRDATQSYSICFTIVHSLLLVIILLWSIEMFCMRKQNRKSNVIVMETSNKHVES